MCSRQGCGRVEQLRRGLCGKHYKQWQTLNGPHCSIKDCPNRAVARTWCKAHYGLWRKYGDPYGAAPRARCAWPRGCDKEVVISRSQSGLCAYHLTRAWKKAHPDLVNASNQRYSAKNPDKVAAWGKKWSDAHPDKRAEYAAARQARLLGQFVERVYRSVVFKRDKGICGICHKPVDPSDWHLDHIIPISRGGEHSYANVQVTHPFCNVSKGAKLLEFELRLA